MPLYYIFVDLKDQSVEVGDIEQEVENASHGVKLEEDRCEYIPPHNYLSCLFWSEPSIPSSKLAATTRSVYTQNNEH